MLKRNSIVKFILLAIIAILGILLCVCPFSVPYSTKNFNGIIPAINKGADLNGGITAVYNCTLTGNSDDLTEKVDNSISKIKKLLEYEKFDELQVTRQGGNKIYILASGEYATDVNDAFVFLEEAKEISFTAVSVSETETNPEVFADSNVISAAYPEYNYDSEAYGVTIEFTKNGMKKLENLKDYAQSLSSSTVYLYLGDKTTENTLAEVSVSDLGKESIFITASSNGSYSTSSANEARQIAYSIVGGSLGVELELLEVSKISPIFGKNTQLYLSISLVVIMLIAYIGLALRYRELGLISWIALTINAVLFAFFMMALPFITLNLAGVIGSIGAFLLSVIAIVFIFEKIKDEYAMGKKIHLSCKGGFKRALWPILDSHFIIIIISAFTWIFAPTMLKCFGIAMMLGALLSMFTSLVVMRGLVKNYLRINSTKAKKLGLYRDKNVKEIKDEDIEIIKEDVAANSELGGSHE